MKIILAEAFKECILDFMLTKVKLGFTLLEILLSIAALVILAGIVVLALNPGKQLAQNRNSKRAMDINAIDKALKQYYIDYENWPSDLLLADYNKLLDICDTGGGQTDDCINLNDLAPVYLTALPQNFHDLNYQIVKKDSNNFGFYAAGSKEHGLEPVLLNLKKEEFEQLLQDSLINSYVLTYSANVNGSIVGPHVQSVLLGEDGVAVEAVPDFGFSFTHWSDGSTDNPRVDINISEDISVIANFGFICGNNVVVDSRDANVYNTQIIAGSLCLFAENLRYLPEVHNNSDFQARGLNSLPAYGVYAYNGNDLQIAISLANYLNYGVLYNWHAISFENVCPSGWRVPSDYEWSYIEGFIDSNFESGNVEWDQTGWRGSDVGSNLKNNFNVTMSGARNDSGDFYGLGNAAYFWTSSNFFTVSAWRRYLTNSSSQSNRSVVNRNYGHSVRCLRGEIVPF